MKLIAKDKIKERMVTKTAIAMLLDPEIVEKVVDFQFKNALQAVKIHNEVEFVGFGKFILREYKVKKRIVNLEKGIQRVKDQLDATTSENRINYLSTKLNGMSEQLAYLKSKLKDE